MTGNDGLTPTLMARRLIRAGGRTALATIGRADGAPYASLVMAACDHDASPLLLMSALAEHAANVAHDGRVSLLYDGTAGLASPLTGARVSVQGRLGKTDAPRHRSRYLARHPEAAQYADFGDFSFYRLSVERAHLVAGFGRIDWIGAADLLYRPQGDDTIDWEDGVVAHMNADHGDAIDLYARYLLGAEGGGWRMTGCDPEGADLQRNGEYLRLAFDLPADTPQAVREAFVAMAQKARAAAPGSNETA
jgi:putative heme iron utilization protein